MDFKDQMICSELFTNLLINLSSMDVKYCCKTYDNHLSESDLDRFGQRIFSMNPQILQARADMLINNKLPTICSQCAGAGPNTFFRSRNVFDRVLSQADKADLMINDATDSYEIVLGNACDLSCVYCNEKYSTSWAKEKGVEVEQIPPSWQDRIITAMFDNMEEKYGGDRGKGKTIWMTLTGGEPTYTTKGLEILEAVSNKFPHPEKVFVIITNGNSKEQLFNRWLKAVDESPDVTWKFVFSLEDLSDRCEAIRYGLVWERVMSNITQLLSRPNTLIGIGPTPNIFSVPNMKEFMEYFIGFFMSVNRPIWFSNNMINDPGLSPKALPPHYSQHMEDVINLCESIPDSVPWMEKNKFMPHLRAVRSSIGTANDKRNYDALVKKLAYLAEKRPNIDMMSSFPHLKNVINWYETNL